MNSTAISKVSGYRRFVSCELLSSEAAWFYKSELIFHFCLFFLTEITNRAFHKMSRILGRVNFKTLFPSLYYQKWHPIILSFRRKTADKLNTNFSQICGRKTCEYFQRNRIYHVCLEDTRKNPISVNQDSKLPTFRLLTGQNYHPVRGDESWAIYLSGSCEKCPSILWGMSLTCRNL